jgi:hypothetical protein
MSSRFVVIIPGHGARVKNLGWDPGATAGGLEEAVQVRLLARVLSTGLTTAGVPHLVADPTGLQDGHDHPLRSYGGRARAGLEAAKRAGASEVVVLHLHLNAGKGRYGLVVTDARAPNEAKVAAPFATAIQRWGGAALTECKNANDETYPRARDLHDAVWGEGRYFPGVRVSSLVLEPAFIDQPQHEGLCGDSGLFSLARWLVAAVTEPAPNVPAQLHNPFATLTVDR